MQDNHSGVSSQFSTVKFATRENSSTFAVTRTHSLASACAEMSISFGPMAWASRLIGAREVMRNWFVVYMGNVMGGTVLVASVYWLAYVRSERMERDSE